MIWCCWWIIGRHSICTIIRGSSRPPMKSSIFRIGSIIEPTAGSFSTFCHYFICYLYVLIVYYMCFSFLIFSLFISLCSLHWMLTLNRIYSYYLKPQPFSRREFQATAQDIYYHWYIVWYTSSIGVPM